MNIKKDKVIGVAVQASLLIILFELIEFVSSDPSAAGVALMASFLCSVLFKYAGDYKRSTK